MNSYLYCYHILLINACHDSLSLSFCTGSYAFCSRLLKLSSYDVVLLLQNYYYKTCLVKTLRLFTFCHNAYWVGEAVEVDTIVPNRIWILSIVSISLLILLSLFVIIPFYIHLLSPPLVFLDGEDVGKERI